MRALISVGLSAFCGGIAGAAMVLFLQQNYTVRAQAGPPEVVVTQALRLVDAVGRPRAELQVDEDGSVQLGLKSSTGEVLVGIYADESTGGWLLTKATGKKGYAMFGSDPFAAGGSRLVFSDDREGNKMISLGFGPGFPGLRFTAFDAGVPRSALEMTLSSSGSPSLWLQSPRNGTGVRVFAYEEREGGAAVTIQKGFDTRAVLGNHEVRETRTGSTVKRPGSSLLLFDESGKVVTSLP